MNELFLVNKENVVIVSNMIYSFFLKIEEDSPTVRAGPYDSLVWMIIEYPETVVFALGSMYERPFFKIPNSDGFILPDLNLDTRC